MTNKKQYDPKTEIKFHPIGVIHSPFKTLDNMPIQPSGAAGVKGTIELFESYSEALKDLDEFSYIFVLYFFHKIDSCKLTVIPFLDTQKRGLFATRAPKRPNPIGLSIVKLDRITDNILHIENIDILDGTPLLDIKPYVPTFDMRKNPRTGWLEKVQQNSKHKRSDHRFK